MRLILVGARAPLVRRCIHVCCFPLFFHLRLFSSVNYLFLSGSLPKIHTRRAAYSRNIPIDIINRIIENERYFLFYWLWLWLWLWLSHSQSDTTHTNIYCVANNKVSLSPAWTHKKTAIHHWIPRLFCASRPSTTSTMAPMGARVT